MACYKKIFVISLILFFILTFSFNCFATEIPEGYISVNSQLFLSDYNLTSDGLSSQPNSSTYYIDISRFSGMLVLQTEGFYRIAYTNSLDGSDTVIYDLLSVNSSSYSIDLSDNDYKYFLISYFNNNKVTFFVTFKTGLRMAIEDLSVSLSSNKLWDTFKISIPYILVVVVVSFGVYILVKLIRGLSKGKGRL